MKLRARLGKLLQTLGDLPPPDQLEIIEVVSAEGEAADGQPPGVYYNVDGKVATMVVDESGPDPAVLASLQARLPPWGLTLICHPR